MAPARKLLKLAAAAVAVAAAVASAAPGDHPQCSISPFPQMVMTGQLLPFTITPPEFASCADATISVDAPPTEGTLMAVGTSLLYQAPAYESDDVASLVVKCPSTGASCELLVGFLVSAPPTTTPAAPTTAGPSTTPGPTTTTEAPLPQCPAGLDVNATVPLNSVFTTSLPAKLDGCSGITTYRADSANAKGRLYVNLVGSVLIVGSQFETLENFAIVASCDAVKTCSIPVRVVSFKQLTAPPTSTVAPGPAACPNIYYYEAPIGAVLSSSLRDMPGQPSCAFGRAFSLISAPKAGTLALSLNGDFTYAPPNSEGWAEFAFELNCMGAVSCIGVGRLLVTKGTGIIPVSTTPAPTGPSTPFVSDGYTTCSGSCNENAWKVLSGAALTWDSDPAAATAGLTTPRGDRQPLGGVGVDFINGSLVLKGYAQVGSLAARFLTFEPVTDFTAGKDAGLASFSGECLANQPQIGFAEEVWKWQSLANKTGHVGIRYNSGSSYYHKFGGKHIGCDTFAANPCRYAPMLSPNKLHWRVDVSSCDVTWTGTFNVSALTNLRNSRGEKVFYYTSSKDVEGVVYSQGTTAKSWLEPAQGAISNTVPHQLSMTFDTAVAVAKSEPASPFTLDAQYYEYTEANGDKAFGINLLFFSLMTPAGKTFTADRHVKGFRYLKADWRGPNRASCPTCTGAETLCTLPTAAAESAFTGNFSHGTCANGAGVVTLKKGPAFAGHECEGYTITTQPTGRVGFSAPANCVNSFQNLTLRGVAAGSRGTATPISFEGTISLQLLLDNGARPIVNLDLSAYVARVAIGPALRGALEVCRSTPYWPVYDPLGDSLPDAPHRLWKKSAVAAAASENQVLCLDKNDMRFGPTSWAVLSLNAPGLNPAATLTVESIFVTIPSEPNPVYLMYRDPATGLYGEPSAAAVKGGTFWKRTHPFLNFRFINNASKMSRAPDVTVPASTTFGFAFTPGAYNVDSSMVVTAVVRATTRNADGTTTEGAATFRRTIFLDPLLSALTRYGPITVSASASEADEASITYELAVAAAVTIGIIFAGLMVISADEDRKLPKWMPRATIIRDIPVLGGVVVGKKKKKPAAAGAAAAAPKFNPNDYRNPYEAAMGAAFNP